MATASGQVQTIAARGRGKRHLPANPQSSQGDLICRPPAARPAPPMIVTDEWRRALREDEFELRYQPQFCLSTRKPVGVEALLRWRHPRHGLLAPGQFLGALPRAEARTAVGSWVVQAACHDAAAFVRAKPGMRVAINLFEEQWLVPDFPGQLRRVAERSGIGIEALELEITEDIDVLGDRRILQAAYEARSMGAAIAIDDFGAGFMDFRGLAALQFDTLKIDRSMIDQMSRPLIRAIIAATCCLAERRGVSLVAEGVSSTRQIAELVALGCTIGQGYLLSRPIEAADVLASLHAREPTA